MTDMPRVLTPTKPLGPVTPASNSSRLADRNPSLHVRAAMERSALGLDPQEKPSSPSPKAAWLTPETPHADRHNTPSPDALAMAAGQSAVTAALVAGKEDSADAEETDSNAAQDGDNAAGEQEFKGTLCGKLRSVG